MKKLIYFCAMLFSISLLASLNLHAAAEIEIKGNGNNIVDGQVNPIAANWTHMGILDFRPNNTFIERTFSIRNIGDSLLFLGNVANPVVPLSGGNVGFSIVQQPAPILGAGQATPIKVRFQPFWSTTGLITSQINIPNTDANENPFNFNLGVTVIKSEISVIGNGQEIPNNSNASLANQTDFGNVVEGSFVDRTYVIRNTNSTAVLYLYLPMSVSNPQYFTVIQQPASFLNPGQDTSFIIRFTPTNINPLTPSVGGEVTILNSDLDESTYNFDVAGQGVAPEIAFLGTNGVQLPDGFNPPTGISGTDFGSVTVGGFKEHTFSIQNAGEIPLTLSLPATNLGNGFSVVIPPTNTVPAVGPTGYTQISIRFQPTNTGVKTAELIIDNNDANENPYNISLQGIAFPFSGDLPEINILGDGQTITNGSLTTLITNHTHFGDVAVGATLERTFTIQNTGSEDSYLSVSSTVQDPNAVFTVISQPSGPVVGGLETTITIRFSPTVAGYFSGTVSIENDDADENPYQFTISGQGN